MQGVTTMASLRAGSAHSFLLAFLLARGNATQGPRDGRALAFAAFATWLMTEGLGAYMLSTLAIGGRLGRQRGRPGSVSLPVMLGHAGLAFAGFTCWIGFLVTSAAAPAWLAVGFLAPAIGLGISTVTIWTPFPGGEGADPGPGADDDRPAGLPRSEPLARALADAELTSKLVDDLVASMLAAPRAPARRTGWRLAPLIPAAHGVFAIITFLLATLAAVAAISVGA